MNLSIKLPEHWSPEQADLIMHFVDVLYDALWNQYGDAICELWSSHEKTSFDAPLSFSASEGEDIPD